MTSLFGVLRSLIVRILMLLLNDLAIVCIDYDIILLRDQ